jgi:hypothetical protein
MPSLTQEEYSFVMSNDIFEYCSLYMHEVMDKCWSRCKWGFKQQVCQGNIEITCTCLFGLF